MIFSYKFTNSILLIVFICSCFTILASSETQAQDKNNTQKVLRTIADAIIANASFDFVDERTGVHFKFPEEAPDSSTLHLGSRYNDWRYWNGIVNIAMLKLAGLLNDSTYSDFALKNVAFAFDYYEYFETRYQNENKWSYPFGQFFVMDELDDCGAMGASVIDVYKIDSQERFEEYIDKAADHILNEQSRLEDGTLVRSFPHKWTLWADDLYMSISFLSRMGELTNDNKYFDYAALQVVNFNNYLYDLNKELMYHNWYSDINQKGVAFWGRANGWAILAQVDLLDRIPKNYPQRDTLIKLFQRQILSIAKYQSASGLWHQLLDKEDSYQETSCSAMFTYAVARAVNKGYLEKRYASIALKGWEGILTKIQPSGEIESVCTGTVVSDNLVDYYDRPEPLNDIHGIGVVLLAGSEILLLSTDE